MGGEIKPETLLTTGCFWSVQIAIRVVVSAGGDPYAATLLNCMIYFCLENLTHDVCR